MPRCPGQDMRYWLPEDIFDVKCPRCELAIEFWKDEPMRICKGCGKEIKNPRIDLGCTKWCKFANQCLGRDPEKDSIASPVLDALDELLIRCFKGSPNAIQILKKTREMAAVMVVPEDGEPCLIASAALLSVAQMLESDKSKLGKYSELLIKAGLDADVAQAVEKLIDCVNRTQGCDMKECAVVIDIAEIAKQTMLQESTFDKQTLLDSLKTGSAKVYVDHNY